ncbi:nitrile hydratase [Arboricoccus pini]|uniref:Nitrile hydratase n=1 Tax=Arboricoccus pini TaxID=1963835 RepID=A0A212R5T1_9PROT|nr:SH3-like domain-containing protein [Arboricoccus pini]SNB67218.1 nitrile hydratase [Arboricoccus pini]
MTLDVGSRVRVDDRWPERQGPAHIRTPHYLRGRRGKIVRYLGEFADPEQLAFNRPAQRRALYHVMFASADLWVDAEPADILVEIFDHWLVEEA